MHMIFMMRFLIMTMIKTVKKMMVKMIKMVKMMMMMTMAESTRGCCQVLALGEKTRNPVATAGP